MRRTLPVTLVVLVAVAVLAQAAFAQSQEVGDGNVSVDGVSTGDRVTGVIQVQQVELNNSIETARFESRFEALTSDEERATLIANRLDAAETETRELQQRVESGRTAELAVVATKVRHLRSVTERSRELSDQLPPDVVEENGIPRKIESLNDSLGTLEEKDSLSQSLRFVEGRDEDARTGLSEIDSEFLTDLYDSGFSKAPGVAKSIFGDERINVRVTTVEGEDRWFYLETEGGEIVETEVGRREDATLRVETRENVLRRIYYTENSRSEFLTALRTGGIEYQGVGITSRVKYGGVSLGQFSAESVSSFLRSIRVL